LQKELAVLKSETRAVSIKEAVADVLVLPIYEGETPAEGRLEELDAATDGHIAALAESGELRGKRDEITYLHRPRGLTSGRVVIVGMGKRGEDRDQERRAIAVGVRHMRGKRHGAVTVVDRGEEPAERFGALAIESVSAAVLDLSSYQTEDRDELSVEGLVIATSADRASAVERGVERGKAIADSVAFTRYLGNEPGNNMTPAILADNAAEMAAREGLTCEILGEDRLKEMGMGALLAVSRGSEEPPRLIVLKYEPEDAEGSEVTTFVGKGLTFDSGGISIKPREGMEWMKYDMCGGATVIGALQATARLKPRRRVMGLVPSSENLPSGKSYKPGDVLRSYLGKTIEVLNTDAEGRLILADALAYAVELGATRIVDLATLTGACVIALGHTYAAVMGNDQAWVDELLGASKRAGEKLWQLPMDRAYREQIRSDIADIKNLGGRTAGTITAGYFLREFVGKTPWAHMDIAGTAWIEDDRPDLAKGASGYGVRTLLEVVAPVPAE
jgi:leucyl aminopeptidase